MNAQEPDKHDVLIDLLKDAWVYVHFDPRREGVILPAFLREGPRVVLQYGYNMPVPIRDLEIDAQGIFATLSFRREMHRTFVPFSAVFAMVIDEKHAVLWEKDVPADLLQPAPTPAKPPTLTSVPAKTDAAASTPTAAPAAKPGKRPRPSHLKLVD
jgi:hypothetical protein